jgi:high-affinity iron transporter
MLSTTVIVFREVLEAALIIGIVLAASEGLARRGWWIGSGIAVGLGGALVVALFAGAIATAVSGMGQELFNASILIIAVIMLGWHNVWMGRHGRKLAWEMNAVGRDVVAGSRPMYMLVAVVGLAVLREGSEVVLFLYGIAAAQQEQTGLMLTGGMLGLVLGAGMGLLLYFGMLRIPSKYLFSATSWLITLLAAGMASQAAGFLAQADMLPTLVSTLWDTSSLLPQKSLLGKLLQTLVGYTERPMGIQVLFYVMTLGGITLLMRAYSGVPARKPINAVAAEI